MMELDSPKACVDDPVSGDDIATRTDEEIWAIRNDYRWTPACQRAFLEELSVSGSVLRATKHVGKSPRAAYNLRFRHDGAAFRLGWDAAILLSRDVVQDVLMDRAINGHAETTMKNDDGSVTRCKIDNRLGQALLGRLDRLADAQALRGSRQSQVQLIVQDFENFLDLIARGGKGSEAALFFETRDPAPTESRQAVDCELERISAAEDAVPHYLEQEPEVAAGRLGIWFDEDVLEWRTNFPKADPADNSIEENGFFGDEDYERSMSKAEENAHIAALQRTRQPWIDAASKVRDAWFGEKLAA